MKNIALNTLKYTGIVTLSQYVGSKKVKVARHHNTGGTSLFNFLADCLIGDFAMAKATRPIKIMLVKRTKEESGGVTTYNYEQKSGFIFVLTTPEKVQSNTQCRVRYSFIIPKDQIESINDFEDFGIGLYTAGAVEVEPENFAAFCELDLSKNSLISASLVVDWELIVSNNVAN